MKIPVRNRIELVEAAIGKRLMDIVIKNTRLVNVFTGEIYSADIGIYDGFIAHIEADPDCTEENRNEMEGKTYIDGKGMFAVPGLIDTHLHIESSMLTPANYAKAVVPHGTTTIITDPHEIGNVLGIDAVEYMHEASENLPIRNYILAPSCIPAVPGLENSGATFLADDIEKLLKLERVIGLGEVMDFNGVINNSERMVKILELADRKNVFIQGHSPMLKGRNLSAYICAGPNNDHESRFGQEARDKLRMGMTVDARESSMSQNVSEIVSAMKDFCYPPNMTLCSDDREPGDILRDGHINFAVKKAIEAGLDTVYAIRCATIQAANSLGIKNLGAVAPGYTADILLIPDLKDMKPEYVFCKGELVAKGGKLLVDIENKEYEVEKINTVNLKQPTEEDFKIKVEEEKSHVSVRVINYLSINSSLTEYKVEDIPIRNGYLDISYDDDLNIVVVFNRYGKGNKSIGLVRNFGIKKGAIAGTVSHDSHNVTVVASNEEDALVAVNAIIESEGGISCALDGEVLDTLPLPIAGLMSPLPAEELDKIISRMKESIRGLGIDNKNPLLRIATIALPVIPSAKITDLGLVSVTDQKLVTFFVK